MTTSFNLTTIFQSLMLPYLSYVLLVWDQAAKSKVYYTYEVFLKTPNSCCSFFFFISFKLLPILL